MTLSRYGEFCLLLVATLTVMVGAVLAPGLTTTAQQVSLAAYPSLLITLPSLGAVIFAPLMGYFIDRFGAYPVLISSLLGYGVFGVAGIWSSTVWQIVTDRILLGAFAAGAMAAGTALISVWYSGMGRLNMIARQGMAIELGGVIFLFFAGWLSEWHWQAPFFLYAISLVLLIMVRMSIPSSAPDRSGPTSDTSKPSANSISYILLIAVLAMGIFFSIYVTLPVMLADNSYRESQVGIIMSYISFIAVIAAMGMPKVVTQFSAARCIQFAFTAFVLATGLYAISYQFWSIMLAATLTGIGFGLSIPLLNHSVVELSNENNRGKRLSYFSMAVFSGQFLTSGLDVLTSGYTNVFLYAVIIAAGCLIVVLKKPLKIV